VSADYHCLIHGLVLASEVELPIPRIRAREADLTYRVALEPTRPPGRHHGSDDPDAPWAIEHWHGTRLAVEFPGFATFELSRTEVTLVADDTGDPDLMVHLLLDHVVPRVVSLRGDLMLHAGGALGRSGRAHLLLGKSGAGKSTLVTDLVSHGWLLLDDDGIRVTHENHGFRAVPGSPGVRLHAAAAAMVLPHVQPGRPMSMGHAKRRFAADDRWLRVASVPAPIACLYALVRVDSGEPSVTRLGFAEALGVIVEHGFHLADEPASITRLAFERASALAATTPVLRLFCPAGLEHLPATRALMAKLDDGEI
jgi:hypothetical protein